MLKKNPYLPYPKYLGQVRRGRYASACKYISLARNALAVLIGSCIAYALTTDGMPPPFALTGKIRSGFPAFGPPPFETWVAGHGEANGTLVHLNGGEMLATMGSSLVALPFVAILEIVVVAKAFGKLGCVSIVSEKDIRLSCISRPLFGSLFNAL